MKHFSRFEIREESKTNYLRFSKNTSSLVARPFCDSILVIWKTFLFHTISRWVPMKPIQIETIETIFFVCTKREDLLSLKTTFKKYIRSRFLSFDPSPPLLFVLVRFWAPTPPPPPPPSPHTRYVRSGENSPSLLISILVKFREKKLIMSTSTIGWTQRAF